MTDHHAHKQASKKNLGSPTLHYTTYYIPLNGATDGREKRTKIILLTYPLTHLLLHPFVFPPSLLSLSLRIFNLINWREYIHTYTHTYRIPSRRCVRNASVIHTYIHTYIHNKRTYQTSHTENGAFGPGFGFGDFGKVIRVSDSVYIV